MAFDTKIAVFALITDDVYTDEVNKDVKPL